LAHAPETGFTLNTVRLDSASGVLSVYRDKRFQGSLTGLFSRISGAAPQGYLGGIGACEGLGWAGDIAEILVYGRALNEAERDAVETYLHQKWLLALKAYEPDPPDGATNVALVVPTWTPGYTARTHELYIGTSRDLGPADLVFSGSVWPPASYQPSWLPKTTYFWRVDEVEADRALVHTGDVWSFVTAPATAYEPHPRDGARFVDRDIDPLWRPGLHAVDHDVYFGTSRQDVLNGTGGTFQGRRSAPTFDPGPLAEETPYHWRIDEVAADGQIHRGSLWSFTTFGSGGGVKAEYFNNMSRHGEPVVTRVDPAIDFNWGGASPDPAVETDYFSARWTGDLDVAFTDTYTFTVRTTGYVSLWVDDVKLIERHLLTPLPVEDRGHIQLATGVVHSLRLDYEIAAGQAVVQLFWQSSSQPRQIVPSGPLQPPVRSRRPVPGNGAANTGHDLMLRWLPGWKATHHDVYFGPGAPEVANGTPGDPGVHLGRVPLGVTELAVGTLQWNKSYFWRVDEVNEVEPKSPDSAELGKVWKGNLWTFTTAGFLPVDDFESYTDETGNRLFDVWLDGWTNGTGSALGDPIPGSRPTFGYSGSQSMTFDYNNTGPPYYSEVRRTWAQPQDWTVNGIDELSLWLLGSPVTFLETPTGVVISGAGGDMDCTYDPYRLAWRQLDGDGEIVARIDRLDNAQGWARAGLIIAETPDLGSTYVTTAVTAGHGLLFANCPFEGSARVRRELAGVRVPSWLKLTRTGNQFTAAHSQNGVTWHDVTNASGQRVVIAMDMPHSVVMGLCVTSHAPSAIATAEFSGIRTSGIVSTAWEVSETGFDQPGNSQEDILVILLDAAGREGVYIHPDLDAINIAKWTQWKIPLSFFRGEGVDLRSVKSLYLWIGDRDYPRPGSTGTVYIDDIRVDKTP
jgi:hypothetical protein